MRPIASLFCLLVTSLATPASPDSAAWATALRGEFRVGHDTNVFLQDPAPLAAGQTVRITPVRAEATESVLGAMATLRRRPAATDGLAAEFGYGFEWHRFDAFRAESHRDHRLMANLREVGPVWLSEAKLSVLEVNGSSASPAYNEQGGVPAIGGEPVRSRRAQTVVNTSTSTLWRPPGALRLRGHFAVQSQDFHTLHDAKTTGCANYVDRAQALAGVDAGRALTGELTLWTSLRAGRVWQANLLGRTDNFSHTILRPLVGLEGRVAPTLRLNAWTGPDYRRFTSERRAGTDAVRVMPFFETNVVWTPATVDTVTLGAREQLWPSSAGRSAYRDFRNDAAWQHRFTPALDTTVRAGVQHANFAGFAASPRNEIIFNAGVSIGGQLASRTRLDAGLSREWAQTRIPNTPGRAYERWLASVGVARTW